MSIGLNVLGLPQPDVTALLAWVAAAKPPYLLVMDSHELEQRFAYAV